METRINPNFTIYDEKLGHKDFRKLLLHDSKGNSMVWGGGDTPGPGGPEVACISQN